MNHYYREPQVVVMSANSTGVSLYVIFFYPETGVSAYGVSDGDAPGTAQPPRPLNPEWLSPVRDFVIGIQARIS